MKARLLLLFLLVFLVASSTTTELSPILFATSEVQAQESLPTLDLTTDEDYYYVKGQTMQINATSNETIDVTLSVYWNWKTFSDNELVYQNRQQTNHTWNIPTANAKVGFYKIVANTSESTVTIWRTLIHHTSYIPESLPFSHVWKGINYTLEGRILTAEKWGILEHNVSGIITY